MEASGVTADGTARGRVEARILAAIAAGRPDLEVHYLFGGFVVVPKGTPVIGAAMLEVLWERVMEGTQPGGTVTGTVVRNELPEGAGAGHGDAETAGEGTTPAAISPVSS